MNAPMSALAKYLLNGYVGKEIKEQFLESIRGNSKNQFYKKDVSGFTLIDSSKNSEGKIISKEDKNYTLSQIISSFREGERTIIKKKDWKIYRNLENYFEQKGPHFCAGYLSSRFGEIVRPTLNFESPLFDNIPYIFHKLTERKQFQAAQKVWFNSRGNSIEEILENIKTRLNY
ncbi:hypothetical protein GW932_03425 [archaeon]|nr:hypothetical protein [archaeon]